MTKTQKDRLFILYFILSYNKKIPIKNIGKMSVIGYPPEGYFPIEKWNTSFDRYSLKIITNSKKELSNKQKRIIKLCGLMIYNQIEYIKIIKVSKTARSSLFRTKVTLNGIIQVRDLIGDRLFKKALTYFFNVIIREKNEVKNIRIQTDEMQKWLTQKIKVAAYE